MLYVVRIHQKRISFSFREAVFWYFLWSTFIFLTLFPQVLIGISKLFIFDRVFDLLIVGAFMVISFLVVGTYFKYREMNFKLDKLVRDRSILNLKNDLKNKKKN